MTRHRHGQNGHERVRLPRWTRWCVFVIGSICALSGTLWLWLHHAVIREGEFGPEPHRLEHPSLVLHGISGMAMVWVFGVVWLPHVRRGWAQARHRVPGGIMAMLMFWLALSAAGLYYLGDDTWREWISMSHWVLGMLATVWLPTHIWIGRRPLRQQKNQLTDKQERRLKSLR